jgi:hypothetical protein
MLLAWRRRLAVAYGSWPRVDRVFRLYDIRTGQPEQIRPAPGGLLRLQVRQPDGQGPAHAGDLRLFLVADLIRRNAEHRHNLSCLLTVREDAARRRDDGTSGADGEAFRADAAALNLRPADQATAGPGPAEPVRSGEIMVGTCRVAAGQVKFSSGERDPAPAPLHLSDLAGQGLDPLALRLAFLSGSYREAADLTWDALREADRMLRRWRERVAEWAESPSKPLHRPVTAQVGTAFDDDLDTPAALRALAGLEQDPAIPNGSKFESFLHADQLLALDLPRDIGRIPLSRNDSSS